MTTFRLFTPNPRLGGYLSGLALESIEGGRYEVMVEAEILAFADHMAANAKIAPGFRTDLASIPKAVRWLIPRNHNDYRSAAVVHDWLYSHHGECARIAKALDYDDPRLFADQLKLVMASPKSWRAPVMYWALRWFGYKAWSKYNDES